MKRILALVLTLAMLATMGLFSVATAEDELVDGKFAETRHITVDVFNRYNDGGTDPTTNVYAQYIHDKMLEKYNIDVTFNNRKRWGEDQEIGELLTAKLAADVSYTYNYNAVYTFAGMGGIINLAPYFEKYKDLLPNLYSTVGEDNLYYQQDPDTKEVWAFRTMLSSVNRARINTFIRKDWLDKLGLAVPTTTQQFEDALVAFRDNAETLLGADADKLIPYSTTTDIGWRNNHILTSFVADDLNDETLYVYGFDDRNILYPGTKEGVRLLNKWYNMGLIWKDFALNKQEDEDSLNKSGWIGAFQHNYDYPYRNGTDSIQASIKRAAGEEASFIAIEPFLNDAGVPRKFLSDAVDRNVFFPATNDEILASLLYLDFISDPETIKFLQIGKEGIVHEVTEDGAYKILPANGTEWIQNSVLNIDHTMTMNGLFLGDATAKSFSLTYAEVEPELVELAYNTAMDGARIVKKFTLPAIEAEASLGSALADFRDTWLSQAIVCSEAEFDSKYDQGLEEYLIMGGQEIIDERAAKLQQYYGVEIPTDLLTK